MFPGLGERMTRNSSQNPLFARARVTDLRPLSGRETALEAAVHGEIPPIKVGPPRTIFRPPIGGEFAERLPPVTPQGIAAPGPVHHQDQGLDLDVVQKMPRRRF